MNVAELFVEVAARLGCDSAFSLTGGMAMHLNRAAHEHPSIDVVYCHHETACVAAAEGYSMTRELQVPGLAIITSGPGVSNAMTGILSANGDSCPVLVLAGQIKTADIDVHGTRTHGMQEIDSAAIVSPAVKQFVRADPGILREQIAGIVEALTAGRKGVVFVEIPLDVQSVEVAEAEELLALVLEVQASARIAADGVDEATASAITDLVDTLSRATQPAVVLGNGLRVAGADVAALIRTLDAACIPRFYTWMSQDLESSEAALNMGCPGGLAPLHANRLLQEADAVATLGARLDLGTTAFQPETYGTTGRRFVVDIDPAELSKLAKSAATVLVEADAAEVAEVLIARLPTRSDSEWRETCVAAKAAAIEEESQRLDRDDLTVREVSLAISDRSANKVVVTASSGSAIETFIRFFRPQQATRCFHGGALGSMGVGLAHGIGAAQASGDRRVWIVESDGGLWMNIQELATLKRYASGNVTLFVLNNDGYASIRLSQQRLLGLEAGAGPNSGVYIPPLAAVATAVGLEYSLVQTPDQLAEVLDAREGTSTTVALVEIVVPANEDRGPQLRTVFGPDGPRTPDFAELSW